MKYARIERERRFLVTADPPPAEAIRTIEDRYVLGTRLRLRRVSGPDGFLLKLGRQEDLEPGVKQVTTIYLDEAEFALLAALPARTVEKIRATVRDGGILWAIDRYPDGIRIAESEEEIAIVPPWLGEEITGRAEWWGASMAR